MEARRTLRRDPSEAEEGRVGGDGGRVPRADLAKLRCLVGFCILGLLALTMPVLYLLNRSARQASEGEMPTGKMPELQRLKADAPNCGSCTIGMKPRTHLTPAEKQPDPNCMSGGFPILHWRNDRPGENDTIKYENGYLMVPEAGDYFVYSQVTFFCPDGKCEVLQQSCGNNVLDEINLTQVISKISESYGSRPRPQLKVSISIGRKEKWKERLYLGGVIRLRENDRLMVNVSNPALVDISSPEITFFGAFLI